MSICKNCNRPIKDVTNREKEIAAAVAIALKLDTKLVTAHEVDGQLLRLSVATPLNQVPRYPLALIREVLGTDDMDVSCERIDSFNVVVRGHEWKKQRAG